MSEIIGIDFGATNSCVAVVEGEKVKIVPTPAGSRTIPSVVAVSEKSEIVVGEMAVTQAITNPEHTVFNIKGLMGREYGSIEVQKRRKVVPYNIEPAGNNRICINLRGKRYSPEEIASFILGNLKKIAEEYVGKSISDAVITVPAFFNRAYRQAIKNAGNMAGLRVERTIDEATAACLAYGQNKNNDEKIFVFDLGGGSLSISILEIGEGVFEVKATKGSIHLGGEAFDLRMMNYLIDEFKKTSEIDARDDAMAMLWLRDATEKARNELSFSSEAEVKAPFFERGGNFSQKLNMKISRSKFEALTEDLINALEGPCRAALKDAGLSPDDIDKVILVGGMTRMPAVREKLREIFGKETYKGLDPDEEDAWSFPDCLPRVRPKP